MKSSFPNYGQVKDERLYVAQADCPVNAVAALAAQHLFAGLRKTTFRAIFGWLL